MTKQQYRIPHIISIKWRIQTIKINRLEDRLLINYKTIQAAEQIRFAEIKVTVILLIAVINY